MKNKRAQHNPQSGLSLISLLVGLFISMLCVLASLVLYKNLIEVAAETKIDTSHDGQISTALLTAQLELQAAGFGIANAGRNDIRLMHTARDLRLVWRLMDGGNVACRGLHELTVDDNGVVFRELRLVAAANGCTVTADLSTLAWTTNLSVLGRWRVRGALQTFLANSNNNTLFDAAISPDFVVCSPFNSVVPEAHLQVTLSAPSAAALNGVAGTQYSFTYCLPNTYPS